MKTLEKILKQEPVYLDNWKGKFDLISDFEGCYISVEEFNTKISPWRNESVWIERKEKMTNAIRKYLNYNILFASYNSNNYSGDAFVLFEQDGKLYEVNGGHCSCYGLEGQFTPEETSLKEIETRLVSGRMGFDYYSGNEFAIELKQFLGLE